YQLFKRSADLKLSLLDSTEKELDTKSRKSLVTASNISIIILNVTTSVCTRLMVDSIVGIAQALRKR
ncbi:MAG: hypothetical protein WB587_15245, partial [Nitrososphaeraceae archaeon]